MADKLLHYDVLEQLGVGARSTIYRARDPQTGQTFALKHVKRDDAKDIRFIEQMEAEYEISKAFNHRNLRRSFHLEIKKSLLLKVTEAFLVMELVEGKPLEVRLPAATIDIVDTFIQSAEGLKAMHAMGFAHCDIKPNNILRDDGGKVKVIDFGQSVKIGTIKERIQGTPDFIAPEQVARRPISVQTDVFNLGATLYWCLTQRHIPTLYTVNKKGENSFLLHARIDTPQDLNPKVPVPLSNLVMEMVETKAQKRPADMDQVITRLELVKHILQKQANPEAFRADPQINLHDSAV
ncbi:MAG TPA: serine/threonine-protein kinase [Tepidisphaeraceae bacterium]|nr:serine/threonine-protein kinase [Tepidisphaeraceae bacterium]